MGRLIDADALEREYQERYKLFTWDDGEREKATLARVIQMLHEQPTVEERKTGEWIDYNDEGYVECPFCHSATNCEDNKDELHYCFSCGARMESKT